MPVLTAQRLMGVRFFVIVEAGWGELRVGRRGKREYIVAYGSGRTKGQGLRVQGVRLPKWISGSPDRTQRKLLPTAEDGEGVQRYLVPVAEIQRALIGIIREAKRSSRRSGSIRTSVSPREGRLAA